MKKLTVDDQYVIEKWAALPPQKVVGLRVIAFMLDRGVQTIYNDISAGTFGIPVVKTKKRVCGCLKRDVEDYLESRRVEPSLPSEAAA